MFTMDQHISQGIVLALQTFAHMDQRHIQGGEGEAFAPHHCSGCFKNLRHKLTSIKLTRN